MLTILGIDGLEYDLVVKFGCKSLMQESFGMTDLSAFKEPRTVVIWSSFLSGAKPGGAGPCEQGHVGIQAGDEGDIFPALQQPVHD